MRAATGSQLPGRGPIDVDERPCTCTLIKNPIMMNDHSQNSLLFYIITEYRFNVHNYREFTKLQSELQREYTELVRIYTITE